MEEKGAITKPDRPNLAVHTRHHRILHVAEWWATGLGLPGSQGRERTSSTRVLRPLPVQCRMEPKADNDGDAENDYGHQTRAR